MSTALLRRLGGVMLQGVLSLLVTLGLLEGLVAFSFRSPSLSPLPRPLLRQMHVLFDRNTIQVMPECAVYDPELTYTLRPGSCTFANREFSNVFAINTLGVRDDEAARHQPQIVVLGDSIAMGWGVESADAFPSVVGRLTGRRTLNAGVSSYGTVRELRMLERIDRRSVTDVVLQYSSNDLGENEQFAAGRFKTLSREEYERTVRSQAEMVSYRPGKYALNLLVMIRNLVRARQAAEPAPTPEREARAFLAVIALSPVDLTPYTFTVLSLEPGFVDAVRPLAAASPVAVIQRLRFLDLTSVTELPGAYYVLDDHPTLIGHDAIGRAVAAALTPRS
jgi:lysophospholipase L1-like esterase